MLATFSQEYEICLAFIHIQFYTVCLDKLVVPEDNPETDNLQIGAAYGVVDRIKKKKQNRSGISLIKLNFYIRFNIL